MDFPKQVVIEASVVVKGMEPLRLVSEFFSKEIKEGKTEFRLVVTDKEKGMGYIHPIGKDGSTHDFDFSEYLEESSEG